MRVLQVLAEDTIGGTELHVALLAERLRGRAACDVATLFERGPIAGRLDAEGIPVFSLGAASWPARMRRLAGLVRARNYDVVEAYGIKASLLARIVVRVARPVPVFVCGVQGLHITEVIYPESAKGRFALAVERATTALVDRYDVNSEGAIELLTSAGIARDRMDYIPNGVDTQEWVPGPEPISRRQAVVVCAARLVERKRQSDLVDAFALLRDNGVDARLELLGDGPDRSALEERIERLCLNDVVQITGALPWHEVRERLGRAVAFALPSSWEGMPAAVLEAMSCGLAIVASDVNGTRDVVEHGVTGWLFEPGDVQMLAGLLRSTLEDRAETQRLGLAGRRVVEGRYSLDALVEAKIELYVEEIRRRVERTGG